MCVKENDYNESCTAPQQGYSVVVAIDFGELNLNKNIFRRNRRNFSKIISIRIHNLQNYSQKTRQIKLFFFIEGDFKIL